MFRTDHPENGGWYLDVVMSEVALADEDGYVNPDNLTATVGPFADESEADRTAAHFDEVPHVESYTKRYENPAPRRAEHGRKSAEPKNPFEPVLGVPVE